MPDYITTGEASVTSGYHVVHLRRLIKEGKLKAVKRGRDWWIDNDSLLAYLKEKEKSGEKRGPKGKNFS
jgi:excisionase family DNA binding protein